MRIYLYTAPAALATLAAGQDFSYEYGAPSLCNQTLDDFNATGVYWFNPDVTQEKQAGQPDNNSGETSDFAWALTIQNAYGAANASSQLSSSLGLWLSTNGANFSNNLGLGYDVCAVSVAPLTYNAMLRGQSDDGSCMQTLDRPCISALEARTNQWATWLAGGNNGPQLNLTTTSLPGICNTIASTLTSPLPDECSYFFDDPTAQGGALTTQNNAYATFLSDSCTIRGSNATFNNVLDFSANSSLPVYGNWTEAIYPVMMVFMSIANENPQVTLPAPETALTCVHVNNIGEDSYKPPAAPAPTPINYDRSHGLSGGAIAGIIIGSIAGVALIASGGFWIWMKTKKSSRGGAPEMVAPSEMPGAEAQMYELPTHRRGSWTASGKVELTGDGAASEVPAGEGLRHELPSGRIDK